MSNETNFADRFRDQIVLVTGAASGIGLGIARRIAAEAGTVIAADIDDAALKQAWADIGDVPRDPQLEVADVTSEDEMRDLMRRIVARYGKLDAVVNSAGIVGPTSTEIVDYDLLDFRRVLEVNLVGSFMSSPRPQLRQCCPTTMAGFCCSRLFLAKKAIQGWRDTLHPKQGSLAWRRVSPKSLPKPG